MTSKADAPKGTQRRDFLREIELKYQAEWEVCPSSVPDPNLALAGGTEILSALKCPRL